MISSAGAILAQTIFSTKRLHSARESEYFPTVWGIDDGVRRRGFDPKSVLLAKHFRPAGEDGGSGFTQHREALLALF